MYNFLSFVFISFAFIISIVLSFFISSKVDPESEHMFTDHGLAQFTYPKGQKMVGMSYYLAPDEALEDPSEMREWAQLAYDAALRSRK